MPQFRGTEDQGQDHDAQYHGRRENHIPPNGIGPERNPFFFEVVLIFLSVSFRVHLPARLGRLGDSVAQNQHQMYPYEGKDQARYEKYMDDEYPAERGTPHRRAAENQRG